MGIATGLLDQKGIQYFDSQINPGFNAAGHGAMCRLGNTIFCVYSLSNTTNTERNLMYSVSYDETATWSVPIQITSSNFDEEPSILILDPTDIDSEIGIVFLRDVVATFQVFRMSIDQTGVVTNPADPVGSISGNPSSLSIVPLGDFYGIVYLDGSALNIKVVINLTGFTTNNWQTYVDGSVFPFATPLHVARLKVKQLSDSNYGLVASYITSYNGDDTVNVITDKTAKYDVYFSISDDNMQSWPAAQNLSGYSWTPQWDMLPNPGAANVDFVQISTGDITVAFTEMAGATEVITQDSTNILAPNMNGVSENGYQSQNNILLQCNGGNLFIAPIGFYATSLTTGVTRRFYTGSVASLAIWDDDVRHFAVSADGTYLAVATASSLEIFNCSDPEPNNWVHLAQIKESSDTPLYSRVSTIWFLDSVTLLVGWQLSSVGRVNFSLLDVSNPNDGFTDVLLPSGDDRQAMDDNTTIFYSTKTVGLVLQRVVVFGQARTNSSTVNTFYHVNIDSDLDTYNYDPADTSFNPLSGTSVYYDDYNNQYVYTTANSRSLAKISLTENMSGVGGFFGTPTDVPGQGTPSFIGPVPMVIPGQGIAFYIAAAQGEDTWGSGLNYYSFSAQKNLGPFTYARINDLSADFPTNVFSESFKLEINSAIPYGKGVISGGQLTTFINNNYSLLGRHDHNGSVFAYYFWTTKNRGRLLGATFPYDSMSLSLNTTGIDFYDLADQSKLGSSYSGIDMPAIERLGDDTIAVYGTMLNLYNGVFPIGAFTGIVATAGKKLFLRARIQNRYTPVISIKAHMASRVPRTIQIGSRLVAASCLKLKANIVPRINDTISLRASILNGRRIYWPMTFNVDSGTAKTALRFQFYAQTGYTGLATITMGARIVRSKKSRFTGHFLVSKASASVPIIMSVISNNRQVLSMKANIYHAS